MYKAMLSTDWNQCLAPCGPFDAFMHHYPRHATAFRAIFDQYTGNEISLDTAAGRIRDALPQGLTIPQMDAYLDRTFGTYTGVADLIRWCRDHDVLFMVNTTGMIGYFQRVLAKKLLPPLPILAAHPMVRFASLASDPPRIMTLREITDKATCTADMAARFNIDADRIFLMGDSGGDGPHFDWGTRVGACLIGSMTKPSLQAYCRERGITLNHYFGHTYTPGEPASPAREMAHNFLDISRIIQAVL